MTFPTPHSVTWYPFEGGEDDGLGNEVEEWGTPTTRPVIGWSAARSERLGEFASRSITDVDLLVPPDFSYGLRDRVGLDGGGLYEVIGASDREHGFHGWQPGSVIRLKLVEG